MKLFVTGTDTNVGKTVTSLALCHYLKIPYWKPIQSGTPRDTDLVKKYGITTFPEAYCFEHPLSPHLASRLASQSISLDFIFERQPQGPLLIEGAGGVFVPINQNQFMFDVIKKLDCQTLVVARSTLGTINHTLLTLEVLKSKNIDVIGVILVGELNIENKKAIEHFGQVKVVGEIPFLKDLRSETFTAILNKWEFSWFSN